MLGTQREAINKKQTKWSTLCTSLGCCTSSAKLCSVQLYAFTKFSTGDCLPL